MEYEMEELLPLLEKLTFKYTSGDSSSVTYETGRMLMEAILYCIREYEENEAGFHLMTNEKTDASRAYQSGYEAVIAKVHKTKELYHTVLEEFHDYGCRNLKETFLDGIPAFFQWYDPKFKPQDHILTLDYPVINAVYDLCGVDAVYKYVQHVKVENDFLKAFDGVQVETLLGRIMPDYKNLYYDNIAYAVLLMVTGCIIAGRPVGKLLLTGRDLSDIVQYFQGDSEEAAEYKINGLLSDMFRNVFSDNGEMEEYFKGLGKEYAVRILNGIRNDSLPAVFYLPEF